MPTAVESYSELGAVVVELPPSSAPKIHIDPSPVLGGRSGAGTPSTLLYKTGGAAQHFVVYNSADNGVIGGRSGTGGGIVSVHNPHLNHPHLRTNAVHHPTHPIASNDNNVIFGRSGVGSFLPHTNHPVALKHTPHPLPIHQTPVHFAPSNNIDSPTIGGRSGVGGLLPAVQHHPVPISRDLPQTESTTLSQLLPEINAALQSTLPQGHHTLEAIGVGTDLHSLGVLIGLLRTQGYHVTVASCDGSVRPGFAGPSAILRHHGGAVLGQFLQQLASARIGH